MSAALEMPGVSSAWTMPIKARIDMLSTGIRTPVGIKVYGADLAGIDAVARYGLTVGDLQETILTALGGEPVTTTVDGRARYTVNVRYGRGLRSTPDAIARQVLVQSVQGAAVPLGQLAT